MELRQPCPTIWFLMSGASQPQPAIASKGTWQLSRVIASRKLHTIVGVLTLEAVAHQLLASEEPSIVLRTRVEVLAESADSPAVRAAREAVRTSERVKSLLEGARLDSPYSKWIGLHWVLVDLAELGYPAGDAALKNMAEHELDWLVSEPGRGPARPVAGRYRKHASFEGSALYSVLTLGLVRPSDPRIREAVRRLLEWQWPDGGWNCDRDPNAHVSSIFETVTPLRGLAAYVRLTDEPDARNAMQRAAEVLLSRRLFRRRHDGHVIRSDFLKLHYPCYGHYDVLFGLRVLAEAGFLEDPRCEGAVDHIRSRQLAGGGWPADAAYWRLSGRPGSGRSLVQWGPVGKTRTNEFVTLGALVVLAQKRRGSDTDDANYPDTGKIARRQ
jgi:hypothetical protein